MQNFICHAMQFHNCHHTTIIHYTEADSQSMPSYKIPRYVLWKRRIKYGGWNICHFVAPDLDLKAINNKSRLFLEKILAFKMVFTFFHTYFHF